MPGLTSNAQVGVREDLEDVIKIIDMRSTPFYEAVPKGGAPINALFSWQVDAYETPNTAGVVDGADVQQFENTARLRQRIYGRIQEWRESLMTSIIANDVSDVAGLGKKQEFARGIVKQMKQVKRSIEQTLLQAGVDSQADNGIVPYLTRSMGAWISNAFSYTDSITVPSAFQTPTTSIVNSSTTTAYGGAYTSSSTLVEQHLQGMLQSIFLQTGQVQDFDLYCGATLRRAVTNLSLYQTGVNYSTSAATTAIRSFRHEEQADKEIQSTIDFFAGDFGNIKVVPDLFIARDSDPAGTGASLSSGFVVDTDIIKLRWNRPPTFMPLPDQGGGPRGCVIAIGGLEVMSPLALGKIVGNAA
jgi:hypothetical protein